MQCDKCNVINEIVKHCYCKSSLFIKIKKTNLRKEDDNLEIYGYINLLVLRFD